MLRIRKALEPFILLQGFGLWMLVYNSMSAGTDPVSDNLMFFLLIAVTLACYGTLAYFEFRTSLPNNTSHACKKRPVAAPTSTSFSYRP